MWKVLFLNGLLKDVQSIAETNEYIMFILMKKSGAIFLIRNTGQTEPETYRDGIDNDRYGKTHCADKKE
jgi:hypothetical protein